MNECGVCGIRNITDEDCTAQYLAGFNERADFHRGLLRCIGCKSIRARDPELFDFFVAVVENKVGKATDDLYEQLRERD
jgi:hypothetical protein